MKNMFLICLLTLVITNLIQGQKPANFPDCNKSGVPFFNESAKEFHPAAAHLYAEIMDKAGAGLNTTDSAALASVKNALEVGVPIRMPIYICGISTNLDGSNCTSASEHLDTVDVVPWIRWSNDCMIYLRTGCANPGPGAPYIPETTDKGGPKLETECCSDVFIFNDNRRYETTIVINECCDTTPSVEKVGFKVYFYGESNLSREIGLYNPISGLYDAPIGLGIQINPESSLLLMGGVRYRGKDQQNFPAPISVCNCENTPSSVMWSIYFQAGKKLWLSSSKKTWNLQASISVDAAINKSSTPLEPEAQQFYEVPGNVALNFSFGWQHLFNDKKFNFPVWLIPDVFFRYAFPFAQNIDKGLAFGFRVRSVIPVTVK